jgi:hypothetical protein
MYRNAKSTGALRAATAPRADRRRMIGQSGASAASGGSPKAQDLTPPLAEASGAPARLHGAWRCALDAVAITARFRA